MLMLYLQEVLQPYSQPGPFLKDVSPICSQRTDVTFGAGVFLLPVLDQPPLPLSIGTLGFQKPLGNVNTPELGPSVAPFVLHPHE